MRETKVCGRFGLAVVLPVLAMLSVSAMAGSEGDQNKRIHISNLHRIDNDLYAFGSSVSVEGFIDGDLIAGANDVTTAGEVTGSENVFAYEFRHTGRTGGSIRAFANRCVIDGYVGRSLLTFCNKMEIGSGAIIRRDVTALGFRVAIGGTIMGDVDVKAARVDITGQIDGNVTLEADEIIISPPAVIKGNLTYTSEKEVGLGIDEGVTVLGDVTWELPEEPSDEEEELNALRESVLDTSKMLAAFLFGVILIYVFRRYALETVRQMRTRPSVAIATGLLTLFICVLSMVVLIVSVVLVGVGLLLISGEMAPVGAVMLVFSILMVPITSFAGVSGGILFYSGKVVIALLAGYYLIRIFKPTPAPLGKMQLLLGLIILTALFKIPYLGFPVYLLVSVAGAGGIVLGIRNCRSHPTEVSSGSESPSGSN